MAGTHLTYWYYQAIASASAVAYEEPPPWRADALLHWIRIACLELSYTAYDLDAVRSRSR